MKIVYLSQFYYPEPHSIHKELAETLASYGHEITVVTSYPNYPIGRIYEGWKQKVFGEWEKIKGVSVLRCPVWPSHSKSMFLRGLHFLSFTVSAFLLLVFRVSRPEIFLVHHPPPSLALIAWLLKRGKHCPYVLRMADLWPEFISGAEISKNRVMVKTVDLFMRFIYRTAAHIIVPSPGFKKRLIAKKIPSSKISIVFNYADENIYFPVGEDKKLKQKSCQKETDILILYAGNIGKPQRIDVLIEAMKIIKGREEIRLLIIGEGSHKKEMVLKCSHEGLDSVAFLPQMLPEEVNRYYGIADGLFIQLEDQGIWDDTIPSKIYAYMLSGRPIIAALRGDGADVIREANGGFLCEPCDAEGIAKCITKIAEIGIGEREQMGRNNHEYVMKHCSKDMMLERLETVLKNVKGERMLTSAKAAV